MFRLSRCKQRNRNLVLHLENTKGSTCDGSGVRWNQAMSPFACCPKCVGCMGMQTKANAGGTGGKTGGREKPVCQALHKDPSLQRTCPQVMILCSNWNETLSCKTWETRIGFRVTVFLVPNSPFTVERIRPALSDPNSVPVTFLDDRLNFAPTHADCDGPHRD